MKKLYIIKKKFSKETDPFAMIADEEKLYYAGFLSEKEGLFCLEEEGEIVQGENPLLKEGEKQLTEYFLGKRKTFHLPLHIVGTNFQKKVWQGLLTIPYGETWSYKKLAQEVGSPKGYRAVGSANGANRFSIIIPCHRVINQHGGIGGYGGGVANKKVLIALEAKYK